jgi:hypothetical protein
MFARVVAAAILVVSVPAVAAPTFVQSFVGSPTTAEASRVYNITTSGQGNLTLTATSRKFSIDPTTLTNLSDTITAGLVTRSGRGLGISGGVNEQIDTNNAGTQADPRYEALLLSADRRYSLHSFTLTNLDSNDTMLVFGVDSLGALTQLGFGGTILGGLGGAALSTVINSPTSATLQISPTGVFNSYLFTTRLVGVPNVGQGYSIASISGALPEPGTWAMMIGGFGLVGAALRRQRKAITA